MFKNEIAERDKIKKLISESKYKIEEMYFDYKNNLNFEEENNNINLERGFSFDYECNPDNNDMYYQESTFVIPQLKNN